MRLLVDIGNSRIKAALEEGGKLRTLPAVGYQDADLANALDAWSLPQVISSCWVASVGHSDVCNQLDAWLTERTGLHAHFPQSTASACGVTNAYAEPANLGVDRWLSLIAAHARGGPAIIVSAGTAATIDVVDADGQHLGGLITPGLTTLRKAMLDHTQVRADTGQEGLELLGDSTDACVTYGTLHSLLGYIEYTVAQLLETGSDLRCLITGGDAELLRPHLRGDWQLAPHLVVEGLAIYANDSAQMNGSV